MREDSVEYKELVELFLVRTIYDIADESETPKINFLFQEDAYNYLRYVKENPYRIEGWIIPDIKEQDIQKLRELREDDSCPTIIVKDFQKFFQYLTEITNEQVRLYKRYREIFSARPLCIRLMRRIWLRMTPTDFLDVENFLKQQLEFLKNEELDDYRMGGEQSRRVL